MSNARNLARLLPNASGQLPPANVQKLLNSNMASGSVLQVVTVQSGNTFNTSSSTPVATGTNDATIVSVGANSRFLVLMDFQPQVHSGSNYMHTQIRSSVEGYNTVLCKKNTINYGSGEWLAFADSHSLIHLPSLPSGSSITYKLYAYATASTGVYVNDSWGQGTGHCTTTILEIAA